MMNSRLVYLFNRYFDGLATDPEISELLELADNKEHGQQFASLMQEAWEIYTAERPFLTDQEKNEILTAIHSKETNPAPLRSIHSHWWKYATAAAVILLTGIGSYYWLLRQPPPSPAITQQKTAPQDIKAPESNRATITLSNGQTIYLDSASNGNLIAEGNVQVVKQDGQIIYTGSATETLYNTLYNPRGSKVVSLTLHDGTRVWLNSESSLRYPVAFVDGVRQVEITGEAYFEVASVKHKKVPFIVKKENVQVQVLGTHFNINAYGEEPAVKVTLLEGSVKVSNGHTAALLQPGQQAQVTENLYVENETDIDAVMAWKNGLFFFNKAGLQQVMQQLARWYNIEVVYESAIPDRTFWGTIHRNSNLSEVLTILQKSQVHFRIEGKKLIVLPEIENQ